ncbi:hypothetical protein KIPB_009560, partial [Kipferlia bialata]
LPDVPTLCASAVSAMNTVAKRVSEDSELAEQYMDGLGDLEQRVTLLDEIRAVAQEGHTGAAMCDPASRSHQNRTVTHCTAYHRGLAMRLVKVTSSYPSVAVKRTEAGLYTLASPVAPGGTRTRARLCIAHTSTGDMQTVWVETPKKGQTAVVIRRAIQCATPGGPASPVVYTRLNLLNPNKSLETTLMAACTQMPTAPPPSIVESIIGTYPNEAFAPFPSHLNAVGLYNTLPGPKQATLACRTVDAVLFNAACPLAPSVTASCPAEARHRNSELSVSDYTSVRLLDQQASLEETLTGLARVIATSDPSMGIVLVAGEADRAIVSGALQGLLRDYPGGD